MIFFPVKHLVSLYIKDDFLLLLVFQRVSPEDFSKMNLSYEVRLWEVT